MRHKVSSLLARSGDLCNEEKTMEDIHDKRDRIIAKSKDMLRDVITAEGLWDRKHGKSAFRVNGNGYDVFSRHGYPAYKDFNEGEGIAHDTLDLMEMLYPEKTFLERLEMLASMMGEGSIYREDLGAQTSSYYAKEPRKNDDYQYPDDEEKERIRSENQSIIQSHTRWLHEGSTRAEKALLARGIQPYTLPSELLLRIGYIENVRLFSVSNPGRTYPCEGVVFALDGGSYRIRNTKYRLTGEVVYVSGDFKAQTIGKNALFIPESLEQSVDPVFITEGEIDALSIISLGYKATSIPGVTSMNLVSEKLKERHRRGLLSPRIIIAFDSDEPGKNATESFQSKLHDTFRITAGKLSLPAGVKDINNLLQSDRNALEALLRKASATTRKSISLKEEIEYER